MKDKKSFGEYISQKRKENNLTQEELANKLYVMPTTISKWERGVSYPDITMVSNLCKELNISEHEFFIACDDNAFSEMKKKANKYTRLINTTQIVLLISYIIGIMVCLICNLVIEKRLSWFYIVLNSISISFVITNGVFYLKKLEIKNYKIISMFLITILVYLLLFVCNVYTNGNWLLSIAFPIATFVFLILWLSIGIIYVLKANKYINSSIIMFALSILTLFTNPLCSLLINTQTINNGIYNILTGITFIIIAIVLLIIGLISNIKSK